MSCEKANKIFSLKLIQDIEEHETSEDKDATLWFMKSGYTIKVIMSSDKPITSINDQRLIDLERVGNEIEHWCKNSKGGDALTSESQFDCYLTTIGFVKMCKYILSNHPNHGIVPNRIVNILYLKLRIKIQQRIIFPSGVNYIIWIKGSKTTYIRHKNDRLILVNPNW